MFTTTLANKDKDKFVNWYKRLRIDERKFVVNAVQVFAEENGNDELTEYNHNEFLKLDYQALAIFFYLQYMGLERLMVNSSFTELVLDYRPFTYNEGGKSEYWQKLDSLSQHINA